MQTLRMDVETCPCPVCRSDMAYIYPCESPIEITTVMELTDCPPNSSPNNKKDPDAPKKPVGT